MAMNRPLIATTLLFVVSADREPLTQILGKVTVTVKDLSIDRKCFLGKQLCPQTAQN